MDTIWTQCHDIDLYRAFTEANWENLTIEQRKQLLQEVENRTATARNSEPRNLSFKDLEGGTLGYQSGNSIVINSNIVERGVYRVEVENKMTGEIISREVKVPASNWNLLDTVYHEDTHGIQEDEKRGQSAASYIEGDSNYLFYRLGKDEREAFENGWGKTHTVINYLNAYGNVSLEDDPSMKDYIASQRERTVENYINEAAELFNDSDIVAHIDEWIEDIENGKEHTNVYPVTNALDRILYEQRQRHYQELLDKKGNTNEISSEQNETVESEEEIEILDILQEEKPDENTLFKPWIDDEDIDDGEEETQNQKILSLGHGNRRIF